MSKPPSSSSAHDLLTLSRGSSLLRSRALEGGVSAWGDFAGVLAARTLEARGGVTGVEKRGSALGLRRLPYPEETRQPVEATGLAAGVDTLLVVLEVCCSGEGHAGADEGLEGMEDERRGAWCKREGTFSNWRILKAGLACAAASSC